MFTGKVTFFKVLSSLLWKNIKLLRGEGNIMILGKNIRVKGKQYHLPYNIKAVGKNIKSREDFGEENQDLKKYFKVLVFFRF